MKTLALLCAALVLVAGFASAQAIIDDFGDGDFTITVTGTAGATDESDLSGLNTANVIGGRREAILTLVTAAGSKQARAIVELGEMSLSNESGIESTLVLNYGNKTETGAGTDLAANMTGDIGMTYEITEIDLNGQLAVVMNAGGSDHSASVAAPSSGGTFQIPFSSFLPVLTAADLADVDGLRFTFTGPEDWDVTITKISTTDVIPEPATLSLLGIGLLAAAYRRRKRK